MKFPVDMGISPLTAAYLRREGHDAVHLADEGLHRQPDEAIVDRAREDGRVILTHDLDFAMLMATGGKRLPSVVIFRLADMRPDNVNRHLALLLADHVEVMEAGAILSVSEGHVRVRRLPLT